jgi:cytochrome c-type biogenesis protein CcmE
MQTQVAILLFLRLPGMPGNFMLWDFGLKRIQYDAQKDANHFAFYMKDEKGTLNKVVYNGTKPQDFERSEKLVLIGEMKSGTFYASKILMKCPSKYNNNLVEVKQDGKVEKYN